MTIDGGRALAWLAAEPRPAGGEAEARVRARCAEELRALGCEVAERPFEYSALPGRWSTPAAGVVSIAGLCGVAALAADGATASAAAVALAALAAVGAGGAWAARRGVLALPLLRRRGVNLEARRGHPRVWLVAHLDSKSQPVPMLARAAGVVLSVTVWATAIALLAAQWLGAPVDGWRWLAAAGVAAGLPVALSTVGSRSPGALDDASGVAAVLEAASRVAPARPLGVLLTSAEELGLAGARAWVAGRRPRDATDAVLNCDGVDDDGAIVAMWSGRAPDALLASVAAAAARAGVVVRPRRLIPGLLVDAVAFADAGWPAITLSRGTLRTLARIHRAADAAPPLRGTGVSVVAGVLAGCLEANS
ncbi:MAG TPA: M28 family peptidase [Gemmatimonadaceae bacterium]|nr:M28 family peptidase [Gemmatimonadaceae bacterium]